MTVSFEIHRTRGIRWKLRDHSHVGFMQMAARQWSVVAMGPATHYLDAAGIPRHVDLDCSLRELARMCAEALNCSPTLAQREPQYTIGNTGFVVSRVGNKWELEHGTPPRLTPQMIAIIQRLRDYGREHGGPYFKTRPAAAEQLEQWYRETASVKD